MQTEVTASELDDSLFELEGLEANEARITLLQPKTSVIHNLVNASKVFTILEHDGLASDSFYQELQELPLLFVSDALLRLSLLQLFLVLSDDWEKGSRFLLQILILVSQPVQNLSCVVD